MPRQIQSKHAPLGKINGIVPIDKGGTGASTGDAAVDNLGGLHRKIIGELGGLVQADSQGHLPVAILKGAGITVGYALEGPSSLVRGQTSIFTLTNYNSLADIKVTASAGSVERVNEEIRVTAPLEGDFVILRVADRDLELPVLAFAPVKPTILYPKPSQTTQLNVTAYAAPFRTISELYSAWESISVQDGIIVTFPSNAVGIEVEASKGSSGEAYVDMGKNIYRFGNATIRRRFDRTSESVATLIISGTGSMRYRFIFPTAKHVSTDWQLASDEGFTNILQQSLEDSDNLTSWPLTLEAGQYFIRSRYNGVETA